MPLIVLSLGGNIGDVRSNFKYAVSELATQGVTQIRLSSLYRTKPVDCPPDTPDFLNAALCGFWEQSPLELLGLGQQLEIAAGRPAQHGINTPRPLDIDIIIFGSLVLNTPQLQLPHPQTANRRFVLEPAAELVPDVIVPCLNRTFRELLQAVDEI